MKWCGLGRWFKLDTALWHACAINGMIASYIGVEVSSEVSVPLAQKQSFQSPSMRSPTREAIGVVCLRSFGVDETVAWVLSTRGCIQRISQGENMNPDAVGEVGIKKGKT